MPEWSEEREEGRWWADGRVRVSVGMMERERERGGGGGITNRQVGCN